MITYTIRDNFRGIVLFAAYFFTEDCFMFPSHRRHDLTDHQWSLLERFLF